MILGDCLEVMPTLPSNSTRLIVADVPYSVTNNQWDQNILGKSWWSSINKTTTQKWRGVFFGDAKMATYLMFSRQSLWRYELVWHKSLPQGMLDANRRPLRAHEWIIIIGTTQGTYNPQKVFGRKRTEKAKNCRVSKNYRFASQLTHSNPDGLNFPRSILFTQQCPSRGLHPTQKPLSLIDWLILTYSNVGDMVLDPTAGSGTTAVSACQNGRSVTCIEKDEGYFEASVQRVRKHIRDNLLDVMLEVRK